MENSNVTPLVPKDKNTKEQSSLVSSLSPREIVSELDRFVVGQNKAKKASSKESLSLGCSCVTLDLSIIFSQF